MSLYKQTGNKLEIKVQKYDIRQGHRNYCMQEKTDQAVGFTALTLRRLMSYIYGAPILDVSRSHTTTHHSR